MGLGVGLGVALRLGRAPLGLGRGRLGLARRARAMPASATGSGSGSSLACIRCGRLVHAGEGREVVVEGVVLLHQEDHVLDRLARPRRPDRRRPAGAMARPTRGGNGRGARRACGRIPAERRGGARSWPDLVDLDDDLGGDVARVVAHLGPLLVHEDAVIAGDVAPQQRVEEGGALGRPDVGRDVLDLVELQGPVGVDDRVVGRVAAQRVGADRQPVGLALAVELDDVRQGRARRSGTSRPGERCP